MNFKNIVAAVAVVVAGSALAQPYGCNIDIEVLPSLGNKTVRIQNFSGSVDYATLAHRPGSIFSTTLNRFDDGDGFQVNVGNGQYIYHVHINECQAGGPKSYVMVGADEQGTPIVYEKDGNLLTIGGPGGAADCPRCPGYRGGNCPSCKTCPTCPRGY